MSIESSQFVNSLLQNFDRRCDDEDLNTQDISFCIKDISTFANECFGSERADLFELREELSKFQGKELKRLSVSEKKKIQQLFTKHIRFLEGLKSTKRGAADSGYLSEELERETKFEKVAGENPGEFKHKSSELQKSLKVFFKEPVEDIPGVRGVSTNFFGKATFDVFVPSELISERTDEERASRKQKDFAGKEMSMPNAFYVDHISSKRAKETCLLLESIYPTHIRSDQDVVSFIGHSKELVDHYYSDATQQQKKALLDIILINSTQVLESTFRGPIEAYLRLINMRSPCSFLPQDISINFMHGKEKAGHVAITAHFKTTLSLFPKLSLELEGASTTDYLSLLKDFGISPSLIVKIEGKIEFLVDASGHCTEKVVSYAASGLFPKL